MRVEIPFIFWHGNRDRIMSIDFYPNSNFLVTCGAEAEDKMWIKLWEIDESDNSEAPMNNIENNPFKTSKHNVFMNNIEKEANSRTLEDLNQNSECRIRPKFVYDISGAHTATVNVVRFSPNGMYMASGGDDSAIVIWVQKSRPVEFGSSMEKITWCNHKILRGHLSDIYDLGWSSDSKFLISGSVDNTAIIWNIEKGKGIQKMTDHSHFVQGVSWDPRNKYVVTQSSDKSVRIYKNADMKQEIKFYFSNQIKRFSNEQKSNSNEINLNSNLPVKENYVEDCDKMLVDKEKESKRENKKDNYQHYFADELQCPSFVRRNSWSPDGSILLLVSGVIKNENSEVENVVWGLNRKDMSRPCFFLPTLDKSATCVRFCPIIFNKDPESKNTELIDLPYKMVFAIGTLDSIFIYDTQDVSPKYIITNIHYQPITDLAWKSSSLLAASSSDGYITFCVFDKDELGKPADVDSLPEKGKVLYSNYRSVDPSKAVVPIYNVMVKQMKKKTQKVENPGSSENMSNESSNLLVNNIPSNDNTSNTIVEENPNMIINPTNENAYSSSNNIGNNNVMANNMNTPTFNINNNNINSNNNPQGQQSGPKRRIAPTMLN